MKTELKTTNEINKRDYYNFFPSVHFSYELKKENSLQLSYSKRINRPQHWFLLPFFSFTDSRNIFTGNPNLNPELTDSYEVGHLKYWKKGSLLSSVYYRYTTDVITRIIVSDLQGNTERRPFNLGAKDAFGIEFSGSYEAYKWWNLQGSFNFFREIQEGQLNNQNFDSDTYAWSTRLNSKWTLMKKIGIQSSFNYNAPQNSVQGKNKATYSLDAGFSFDVLKGNGTVIFNASDVFNTRKRRSTSFGNNFISESEQQWRSRYFRLSFTYRINQKKKPENMKNKDFEGGFEG